MTSASAIPPPSVLLDQNARILEAAIDKFRQNDKLKRCRCLSVNVERRGLEGWSGDSRVPKEWEVFSEHAAVNARSFPATKRKVLACNLRYLADCDLGMFFWVRLVMQELEGHHNEQSLLDAVNNLPEGLDRA